MGGVVIVAWWFWVAGFCSVALCEWLLCVCLVLLHVVLRVLRFFVFGFPSGLVGDCVYLACGRI